jgi:hypothetical protein
MTSQKLHEMLIGLYLELGLSLQDALRAAEADLKQLASQLSASEMSSFFGSEGPFHKQYLLQSRKSASSRSDRLKFPTVGNLLSLHQPTRDVEQQAGEQFLAEIGLVGYPGDNVVQESL